ncbi:MAG: hypothetical protein M3O22_00335 [Pseudomonadota bacterium]|nr:hypothetical protein [Pseudomonadota bacterium]
MAGVAPFSDMGILGKIGLILQNTADPSTLGRYEEQLQRQDEFLYQQKQRQKQALADERIAQIVSTGMSPVVGPMGPEQPRVLSGMEFQKVLAAEDPRYLPGLIESMQRENDPMRKAQLSLAQLQLQEGQLGLQARRQEVTNRGALAKWYESLTVGPDGKPVIDPDGPEGPQPPRPVTAGEIMQRNAVSDPEKYGGALVEWMTKASQPQQPAGVDFGNSDNANAIEFLIKKGVLSEEEGATVLAGKTLTDSGGGVQFASPLALVGRTGGQISADGAQSPPGITTVKQGTGPKFTEEQTSAATFAERMTAANEQLDQLSGARYNAPGVQDIVANNLDWGLDNLAMSQQGQQFNQAKRTFINAVLREESGAAIGKDEYTNAEKQYFPQFGDSAEVIAQKAKERQIATDGMRRAAGPALKKSGEAESKGKQAASGAPGAPEAIREVGGRKYERMGGQWYEAGH